MGWSQIWSSFVRMGGSSYSSSYYFSVVVFPLTFLIPWFLWFYFLVDCIPCDDFTIWPLIVSTDCGKYLASFEYVSPGHVAKFPLLIALSHLYFTWNPVTACMYLTRASKLGISYALCSAGVIRFVVVSIFPCPFHLRAKSHTFGRFFYIYPVKIVLPSGDITMTSFSRIRPFMHRR